MRQAAWVIIMALSGLIWAQTACPAQADETGPFPSPSPSASPAAGNGYAVVGFNAATTSGGQIPPAPGSTAAPLPFVSANAGGFSADLLGRISENYLAELKFDDYAVRGNDNPFVSYAQGILFYNPHASSVALGVSYLALQRSTSNVSINGVGVGAALLPRLRSGTSIYGSAFLYPGLNFRGTKSSLTSLEGGLIFSPPRRGGLFFRAGAFLKSGGGSTFSPNGVSGFSAGVGSAF